MTQNTFATDTDLASLAYYSEKQRIQVLACYLLDPRRYSMQEVAQLVLNDGNPQAGQRVSLITRSYGFSSRNAGRYAQSATEQDICDFVRSYSPERTAGGLPEGTFDSFLQARQDQRRRQLQQEQARLRAQREEEARRQAELTRLRQEEERRREAERLRQQELTRQELAKKQQADQLCRLAFQYWNSQSGPGPAMEEGIRLYREARNITWLENGTVYSIKTAAQYYSACADMAEHALAAGNIPQALAYCGYLCDEHAQTGASHKVDEIVYRSFLSTSEEGLIIGRGYGVRVRIFLDPNSGYYDPGRGADAARLGALCRNPLCMLHYAQCLESGTGTGRSLTEAISYYQDLAQYPPYKSHAEEKIQALQERIFQESAAEVAACLNAEAPDAFRMAGHEALPWEAYRDTVLELPALWELYQKAHSTVQTTGLLFKRNTYFYQGRLTEAQFEQVCQHLWQTRRYQYDTLSPDYVPCPGERLEADAALEEGLRRLEAGACLEAASLLRLPALCGSLRAQQALVELCTAHLQNQPLLFHALTLLERGADGRSYDLLANGYARLNRWQEALSWAAKSGEPLLREIRRRAAQWADRLPLDSKEALLVLALKIRLDAGDIPACGRLALALSERAEDPNRRQDFLVNAARYENGEAFLRLAQQEIEAQGDQEKIRIFLERADSLGALPDRELLAEQYASGPEEGRDYVRAAELYTELPAVKNRKLCVCVCAKAYDLLKKAPKGERRWVLLFKILQLLSASGSSELQAKAQGKLGACYRQGLGVERDARRGNALIEEAARRGDPASVCFMATLCLSKEDFDGADAWMERRSRDTQACLDLCGEISRARRQAQERESADEAAETAPLFPQEAETPLFPPSDEGAETALFPPSEEGGTTEEAPRQPDALQPSEEKSPGRREAQRVTGICLAGETLRVKNATEAVTVSFRRLLGEHGDRLEDCLREISQLTDDGTRENSVFRQKAPLEAAGRTVWLGLSTGFSQKCAMTSRLCAVLGLPAGTVSWLGPDGTLYQNP